MNKHLEFFSDTVVALITDPRNDSYRDTAYLCPSNKLTIGFGHVLREEDAQIFGLSAKALMRIKYDCERSRKITRQAANTLILNRQIALLLLKADVKACVTFLVSSVRVPLTQNQFDALIDFTFNVGEANVRRSTLLKKLNTGDYAGAADEFPRWVYGTVNGKKTKLPGLIYRRNLEKNLFLS